MRAEEIEREIADAYTRLAGSAELARWCREHYLDGLTAEHERRTRVAEREFTQRRADARQAFQAQAARADSALAEAAGGFSGAITQLTAAHPWALAGFMDTCWDGYEPGSDAPLPDGLRVGALTIGEEMPPVPAVVLLATHGHLLISENGSPQQARSLLQVLALRLMVATRPGSVRFALADPVGQGQHLSAFLRLPGPLLRMGAGVAASESEVEALLAGLNDHLVDVIQNRLANAYESVEAYNAASAGMTVPYHLLVLAGFPAGFTDRSAKLLTALAQNGPKAGVYVIATVDPKAEMPRDFDLKAFRRLATNLKMAATGSVTCDDPDFRERVIQPDKMPPAERANVWLDAVAEAARSVSRDLPFGRIAVPEELRWRGDSTDGLVVQIGADSRGDPQHFTMGSGIVHHGLIGGNVRMGKTNLLHVLINQLALRYPPEELELYLLDFREVEFDAYLKERLPHARAITSRTDREFGLSMLRKFHKEIARREKLGRESGTTNLPEYRRETGEVMSRALVIMDEFQVMFAEDDPVAWEAVRVLADIAKRGAAFGLHLLLATQSPGDSFTAQLRPVYRQMTLRIAFGCKEESVSQAILGDGNASATKLTRPGDAIYNDHDGEGANPRIRVAALPTRVRREWIAAIGALAGGRQYRPPDTFDPDAPARFSSHQAVADFAASPGQWPAPGVSIHAWLGEAIEIKEEPTSATFERYRYSNLLIVGEEENGRALLLATLLSAAIQRSPADVRFDIAEFARPSSAFRGFFTPCADLPHEVRISGPREAGPAVDALAAELDRRLADTSGSPGPERFFLVAGLHRWQEALTQVSYQPSDVSAKLIRLVEEGPEAGIHLVVWADSAATAAKAFNRDISHFGMRAVMRIPSDSESDDLLGVRSAVSLDDNRALYRDMSERKAEKFKPYSNESLQGVTEKLAQRTE